LPCQKIEDFHPCVLLVQPIQFNSHLSRPKRRGESPLSSILTTPVQHNNSGNLLFDCGRSLATTSGCKLPEGDFHFSTQTNSHNRLSIVSDICTIGKERRLLLQQAFHVTEGDWRRHAALDPVGRSPCEQYVCVALSSSVLLGPNKSKLID